MNRRVEIAILFAQSMLWTVLIPKERNVLGQGVEERECVCVRERSQVTRIEAKEVQRRGGRDEGDDRYAGTRIRVWIAIVERSWGEEGRKREKGKKRRCL